MSVFSIGRKALFTATALAVLGGFGVTPLTLAPAFAHESGDHGSGGSGDHGGDHDSGDHGSGDKGGDR
jgi:hypothetical protein